MVQNFVHVEISIRQQIAFDTDQRITKIPNLTISVYQRFERLIQTFLIDRHRYGALAISIFDNPIDPQIRQTIVVGGIDRSVEKNP